MNPKLFPSHAPPWYAPIAYASVVGASIYAATGGDKAGIGPAFASLAGSMTLFGGLYLRTAQPAEAQPEPVRVEPPPGWNAMPLETSSVDTGRVWLDLGTRMVSIRLTQPQLRYWSEQIRGGQTGVAYKLYLGDSPFTRDHIDWLRKFLPRHNLAVERGNRVILTPDAARAIVEAATRPAGLAKVK